MDLLRAVTEVLAPLRCAGCGVRAAPPWCDRCARTASGALILAPCPRCGGDDTPSHGCWSRHAGVDATTVAYRYEGVVRDTVLAGKIGGCSAIWQPLGRDLAGRIAGADLHAVTWVPTDAKRRRQRGVDQAEALARGVAAGLGLPAVPTLTARPGRADQASRTGDDRRCLAPDAFAARRSLAGARLLLVDDVLTTGATAGTAATALRLAGAEHVHVAVLARSGGGALV